MLSKTVMVVFGTRPEAIKLAPVILKLQENRRFNLLVCVTGQHREMLDQVLDWFRIVPDHDLALMQENQVLTDLAGKALTALGRLIADTRPDLVLVQGDTTTAAVGALAAFYHRVPVGHVEAGLRTRDPYNPFPEEINRRLAGVVARFHFAPTERAAQALVAEQVDSRAVHTVGNTAIDALRITSERLGEVDLDCGPCDLRTILVTAHRRESFGSPFESLCRAIRAIAGRNPDVEIVYPVHLNPNVRGPVNRLLSGHSRIRLLEPLPYEQFVGLMQRAQIILTDSGGIQEEAAALGKPTLVMRETTERQEAISGGTARLVGTGCEQIVRETERLLREPDVYRSMAKLSDAFGDGYAADRIVKILSETLLE